MIKWFDLLLHNFDKHKIRDCKRVRWMHKNTVQRRYRAWSTSKEERQGMQGQLKNNNLESKRIFSRSQAIKVWLTKKWGWSCCCCWKSKGVQRKHKVTFSDKDIERKGGLYDNHDYIDYYLHRLTLFMMVDWCWWRQWWWTGRWWWWWWWWWTGRVLWGITWQLPLGQTVAGQKFPLFLFTIFLRFSSISFFSE